MPRNEDFLSGMGVSPEEQFGMERRAAAVPASEFEGEYDSVGTYNSPLAKLLQRKAWESRMRQATTEETE